MPHIEALQAIRYDLDHVGNLSEVIAPPYDVIDADLQDQLYKKHPANIVRIDLNRDEPGDEEGKSKYTRAAKFLADWQTQGVMKQESQPALYVYHQQFDYAGQTFNRRGFMARIGLQKFGEGNIYPHEETHASAKTDRLNLTRACKANVSQIFGLFPDDTNAAQNLLEAAAASLTPVEATDHLGVLHRMWTVTDPAVISQVQTICETLPVFIADSHHRYETSLNYRAELEQQLGGPLPPEHPAHYTLMMLVSMNDPGLIVLPTHRLFRGLPSMTQGEFIAKLGPYFTCEDCGTGAELAHDIWQRIDQTQEQGQIGFFTQQDGRWTLANITPSGRQKMAEISTDHSPDWHTLGVSILHRLVIETLLAARNLPKAHYVHLVDELIRDLPTEPFSLSSLVMPATLTHIQSISRHLERMPAKSTYFYPKLLAGLVLNPLS